MAPLLAEPARQLGRGRRLSGALEAGEQHDSGGLGRVADLERLTAQGDRELLIDDLDDLLGGSEVLGQLGSGATSTDRFEQVPDDDEVDVSFQQSDSDLTQDLRNLGVA